jgi:hypothetical protein
MIKIISSKSNLFSLWYSWKVDHPKNDPDIESTCLSSWENKLLFQVSNFQLYHGENKLLFHVSNFSAISWGRTSYFFTRAIFQLYQVTCSPKRKDRLTQYQGHFLGGLLENYCFKELQKCSTINIQLSM